MQVDENFQFLVENRLINDYESSFYDMLSTLNEKMIHQRWWKCY